ncbi:hypothetical protein [Empedobacter tilapiae]|uniref:hypothetical protein n=1 Tax=Empedobacter tilapiae TaxID=2491114 RepID=UPI001C869044|nr:hypothetical protein [Empedobacter tilapiae]
MKNNQDSIIKNFKLNQNTNYFASSLLDIHQDIQEQMRKIDNRLLRGIDKRLKLEEVKEVLSNQKYTLEYYENHPLVNRFSFAQDYWGVYNGKIGQTTSIPITIISDFKGKPSVYGGADKKANFEYGVIGNLKKINYPTGGFLSIEYEADQYFMEESQEDNIILNTVTYTTRDTQPYIDFNVKDLKIFNTGLDFTGDNDDGSGIEKIGNCKLSIIDKSTNQNIYTTPYRYTIGESPFLTNIDLKDKSFRMSIQKGQDPLTWEPVECFASFSWNENDYINIPEHNEKIGTLRVKNITLDDSYSNKISRNYEYTNPETTKESGVLYGENRFRAFYTSYFTKGNSETGGKQRVITNNPGWQTNTINGKSVIYKYVTETYKNLKKESENYTKLSTFNNSGCSTRFDGYGTSNFIYPICNEAFLQGKTEEEILKNNANTKVRQTIYDYNEDRFLNKFSSSALPNHSGIEYGLDITKISDEYGFVLAKFDYAFFSIDNTWIQNTRTTTTDYFPNGSIVTTTENHYSPTYKHLYPTSVITKNSKGETLTTEYQYPPDLVSDYEQSEIMQEMVKRNMIATPVITKSINELTVLSEQRTLYKYFPGTSGNLILPEFVYAKKGKNTTVNDRKITYNSYDAKGNLTQYTLENGIPVAIIWGYGGQYPVAKIEGSTFANATSKLANYLTKIQSGTLTVAEQSTIRTLIPDAMLTSYTYKPLIGVTSITGPNGQSEFYNYDSSNRLQSIVNEKNEVIKTFEYNYKQP